MISTIFSLIETRLKAHASFVDFSFFRFASNANSNQKSKGSVPMLCLFWESDSAVQTPKRHLLNNRVTLSLETIWKTSYGDVNDIGRVTEQENYRTAIYSALFPQSDEENFLDNNNITSMRIDVTPLEIGGLEVKKNNGIMATITVEYLQGV